jgi:hypothetical protein
VIVAPHPDGAVAITQADHAVMCAEFADAWGSATFGEVPRSEEVRLAAEQHELGWAELDATPPLDPATGLPFTVRDLPFQRYVRGQVAGPRALAERSPYAALVASLHHVSLYRPPRHLGALRSEGRVLRSFFADSLRMQAQLAEQAGVAQDDPETIRAGRLVRCWDGLSHDLLLDRVPCTRGGAPTAAGELAELRLVRRGNAVSVTPWPFAPSRVEVHARGRLLTQTFPSEAAMHAALLAAPVVTLRYELAAAT